jgi:hypothetical protein
MSMPTININSIKRDDALNCIIASFGLMETALSHILNAEGEKIQKAISFTNINIDQLMMLNQSVSEILGKISGIEADLKDKLYYAVDSQNNNSPVTPTP